MESHTHQQKRLSVGSVPHAVMAIRFWDEVFHPASYLINRMQNLIIYPSKCADGRVGLTYEPIAQTNLASDAENVCLLVTVQSQGLQTPRSINREKLPSSRQRFSVS